MRYSYIPILKDNKGKRYYKNVKYPRIYAEDNDIYVITAYGDSIDVLCYDYYGNTEDYWIIAIANGLPGDARFIGPGTQIRIPQNVDKIKDDFERLNNLK